MPTDIAKCCADFVRAAVAGPSGSALKATHAHELIAAYFGYGSRAALLAEGAYPLHRLEEAGVLVPDVARIEQRRKRLSGLPPSLPGSRELASAISEFLREKNLFTGAVWLYDSLQEYVCEVLLHEEDAHIMNELSGVMAETNAEFDEALYETAEVNDVDESVIVEVEGQYNGSSDAERPFCGDQIDMRVTVELRRVAARVAFAKPDISPRGEVNDDWVDPALRFGMDPPEQSPGGPAPDHPPTLSPDPDEIEF